MTSKEKIEKAWELVNDKHVETNDEIQLVRYAVRAARELVDYNPHPAIKGVVAV
jgi:thymidylate synthase